MVEETGVPGENHRYVISHWQTLSHNVVSSTPRLSGNRTHNVSCDRHWSHRSCFVFKMKRKKQALAFVLIEDLGFLPLVREIQRRSTRSTTLHSKNQAPSIYKIRSLKRTHFSLAFWGTYWYISQIIPSITSTENNKFLHESLLKIWDFFHGKPKSYNTASMSA
jgi:hypothetical protein